MTLRMMIAAGGAVTVLLTGCGGGSGSGSGGGAAQSPTVSASASASADSAKEHAAMLAVSKCMRSNGYPTFPDPVQAGDGTWGWPDSVPRRTAATPCDQLVRQAKALSRRKDRERVSAADMAKLRQFSVCMRQQGVADWPDPTPKGDFILPPRLDGPNGMRLVSAQERACRKYMPADGLRVKKPASGGN